MTRGEIVISKAGSDCGTIYVVLFVEGQKIFVADGKRHKLSNPKVKNLKHISLTDQIITIPKTDELLVTAIRRLTLND